ncbi:hypothetical protein [Vibrio sp. VB16]|uniref:hypothetical protein n=1 Tax=Vibrio sp. VB16 TaxID=2785746 RepID=UPI0018A0A6CC|nr:hypothetical protein [Vibrio sp. VB16]UGA54992.1 hypothetical protein IUZ65_001015 [Vibrio sp. VB16]
MCGIFGVFSSKTTSLAKNEVLSIFEDVFLMSEARGKECSGLSVVLEEDLVVLKSAVSASEFLHTEQYQSLLSDVVSGDSPFIAIGHSRLVTNGLGALNNNNQPVTRHSDVIIHNGIIVNDEEIWSGLESKPTSGVDTEALLALFQHKAEKEQRNIAISNTFSELKGNASICILNSEGENAILATDNGSLYYAFDKTLDIFVFASEFFILSEVLKKNKKISKMSVNHLFANTALSINLDSLDVESFVMNDNADHLLSTTNNTKERTCGRILDRSDKDYPDGVKIKRCTKCILPFSFPGIEFDINGICNKCHEHKKTVLKDKNELLELISKYKSKDGSPDCLVGLSGGRDSCYGLHVIKNELGLNPIAYTYDWGLVTDLARRNIARMCGQLGVEHILVSADLAKKRENVRKNIQAWLKKPDLAMIPLFMAGDKQFYYYAHQLRKQTGVDLFMFAAGNNLERTDFKLAFSGLQGNSGNGILTQISSFNKAKLMGSYGLRFLSNPSYLNSSLFDSFHAFYSSYFLKDDYSYLYHYFPWNEEVVNSTLKDVYDWEGSGDTSTTWRVGDGTAAFYNYIYYVVCGFTEHDTFRSNQVREGVLTRDEALALAKQDNEPRWESLRWYANTVGFNLDEALIKIHKINKRY